MGVEKKILIELKDIQELKKEKSKGIFDDSLRIITKDKEEVIDTYCGIKVQGIKHSDSTS